MSYLQKADALYQMINSGQLLDAFEKYYAEDVVMQEIGEAPRVGKAVNREYEEKFVNYLAEVHGGGIDNMIADENKGVVMIENWMDVHSLGFLWAEKKGCLRFWRQPFPRVLVFKDMLFFHINYQRLTGIDCIATHAVPAFDLRDGYMVFFSNRIEGFSCFDFMNIFGPSFGACRSYGCSG